MQLHLSATASATPGQSLAQNNSSLEDLSLQCVTALQAKGIDALTPSYLRAMNTPSAMKKPELWKAFGTSTMWRMMPAIGKASESMFPLVQTGQPFGVLFASAETLGRAEVELDALVLIPQAQLITSLKEQYDLEPLMVHRANLAINKTNSNLLVSTLLTEARKFRSKKLGVWKPEQGDELEKRAKKLSASDQCIAHLLARNLIRGMTIRHPRDGNSWPRHRRNSRTRHRAR